MPNYKVQLKQGSRTIVEYIEATSVASVLEFYNQVTTMKVTEVLRVEYEVPEDSIIPPDDFQYRKIYKALIKDTASNKSRQIILHNIKLTKTEVDLAAIIKTIVKIEGAGVDSVYCSLMKR